MNELYFGDNLDILKNQIEPRSIDLVYLDPPFNSNSNYNVLFKAASGQSSEAQAEAFIDTWEWGEAARDSYEEIMSAGGEAAIVLSGLRRWLGENAMMAYLVMMAVRLIYLRRAMNTNGSIYLHCDPSASHYLKIIMDAIFGHERWRNEIIWKRTPFSGSSKARAKQLPRSHDVIHFYSNGPEWKWSGPTEPYSEKYLSRFKWDDDDGRGVYRKTLLKTYSKETIERLSREDRLILPTKGGAKYSYKQFLETSSGTRQIDDLWTDINALNPVARERLGYPTQKPVALLERIIRQSSIEGDVVLDPFCGCGTTVEAAQRLGRRWIGIDVTHYAITLIEGRLARAGVASNDYRVSGRPTDISGASELARRDKHQFQWWAAWRLGAQTYREEKRGADRGIDGNIFFKNGPYGDGRMIISVKGGENIGVAMVRDLRGVIEREEAERGILITLSDPTSPMETESIAAGFVKKSAHGRLPRVQIVTIADLLDNRLPTLPPLPAPQQGLAPSRKKRRSSGQLEMLLPIEGVNIKPAKGEFVDPRFMKLG